MVDYLVGYDDPIAESVLRMGPSGEALVLISDVAHVSGHVENGFDRQRKANSNFGRVKFLGVLPAKFTVTFIVLPEEEQSFWDDVLPLLRPKGKRGEAPPMDVVNPQINRVGVETVTVISADIDPPSPRDGRNVTIELEEWTPEPVEAKKKTDRGKKKAQPESLQPTAVQRNQG